MKFIAREDELKILDEEYNKPFLSFVAVYGRRRIGKTELVNHFIKQHSCPPRFFGKPCNSYCFYSA